MTFEGIENIEICVINLKHKTMKKVFLILAVSAWSLSGFSTKYTLDNNPGAPADFTTPEDAMNGVVDGDTIYVQPSPTSYGNISIDKRIVLLGAGHNPEFSATRSQFDNIAFYNGSGESILKGLLVSNYMRIVQSQTVPSVVLANNYFTGQSVFGTEIYSNGSGWIFENNVIYSVSNWLSIPGLTNNTIFRNNLFCHVSSSLFYEAQSGTIFDHNTFIFAGGANIANIFINSNGVVLTNNVIYITAPTTGTLHNSCSSCTWENNITYSINNTIEDLPGNNMNNVDPLFVNVPDAAANFLYTNDYNLTALSPAINAGTDGTDIGLTGGIGAFNMYGFDPTLPRLGEVTLLNSSAPVNGTITLHVRGFASGN
jgi:hypothetical protein